MVFECRPHPQCRFRVLKTRYNRSEF
ncbi:hypothetical protein MTR67_034491 [Solanum verrucosum]|uniref:Uncharacterized protein n=1 Tax=Solanum verrucosum TaxID=315347 RepID=A0AAF0U8G9_SOLVR|nr:hypothetical protein MTR67_034491 [Solanum verrucosum]